MAMAIKIGQLTIFTSSEKFYGSLSTDALEKS